MIHKTLHHYLCNKESLSFEYLQENGKDIGCNGFHSQTQKIWSTFFRECFFRNILAPLHCCLLDIHSCSICSFALWRDCARVFAGCRTWKKPCCRCYTCTASRLCVSVSGVSGSSSQWTLQDKGGKRMAARLCESAGAPLHGPICLSGTHRSYRQSSGRKVGPGLQNPAVLLQQKHTVMAVTCSICGPAHKSACNFACCLK